MTAKAAHPTGPANRAASTNRDDRTAQSTGERADANAGSLATTLLAALDYLLSALADRAGRAEPDTSPVSPAWPNGDYHGYWGWRRGRNL